MESRILIIDDDPEICELVSMALSGKDLIVKTAMSGEDGLKSYGEFKPDIVLLDHRLQDTNGVEVAKKMKCVDTGKKANIIMMSGSDTMEIDLNPDLFDGSLKKPFKLADLKEYINKFLKPSGL
jgi:two-component system OmpR family response regulator